MAVTVAQVARFGGCSIWDITDDDGLAATTTITHLLGQAPVEIVLTPLLLVFFTSQFFVSTISATQVILTKVSNASTLAPTAQVRVICSVLHTLQSLPGR